MNDNQKIRRQPWVERYWLLPVASVLSFGQCQLDPEGSIYEQHVWSWQSQLALVPPRIGYSFTKRTEVDLLFGCRWSALQGTSNLYSLVPKGLVPAQIISQPRPNEKWHAGMGNWTGNLSVTSTTPQPLHHFSKRKQWHLSGFVTCLCQRSWV